MLNCGKHFEAFHPASAPTFGPRQRFFYSMKLPEEFLRSLESVAGFDRDSFVAAHNDESITSIRINPAKWSMENFENSDFHSSFAIHRSRVPWSRYGSYLNKRPSFTFDPLFHAGSYYVQEASSMFLEQALAQFTDLSRPLKILDLCAAPGGKSTHMQSLISKESLLVSNEVIKQRSVVLTDNIVKWGCGNVVVTNNDPKAFQKLPGYFDVLVVDAPCSGSGLFRKDEEAIREWSLNNVALCSQRQQRILADALPALKANGLLIYSTCSYSEEEDERIMDWLVQKMDVENVNLKEKISEEVVVTNSGTTGAVGYRFYPDKIKGEGFFLSCFRKKNIEAFTKQKPAKRETVSAKEKTILREWIRETTMEIFRFRNDLVAFPENLVQDFALLHSVLNIQYAGVAVGQILKGRLVPNHALAQSLLLRDDVPHVDLLYDDAVKYLQRQDFIWPSANLGWQIVRYQNCNLGWANALKNRVNNYYPKEIRILKQNNTLFEK